MGATPVWLTRSLVLMAVGAILSLAVTWQSRTFDVQTAGAVLVGVGLLDAVVNLVYLFSLRRTTPEPPPVRARTWNDRTMVR